MTTTTKPKPEHRYFQNVLSHYVAPVAPEYVAKYAESPGWREVLIAPIPTIEVDEPDEYGCRRAHIGGRAIGFIAPHDTPADWREARDDRQGMFGGAEAIARWIEAHPQPDPESVARVQAARDALAVLTDDERAEVLR